MLNLKLQWSFYIQQKLMYSLFPIHSNSSTISYFYFWHRWISRSYLGQFSTKDKNIFKAIKVWVIYFADSSIYVEQSRHLDWGDRFAHKEYYHPFFFALHPLLTFLTDKVSVTWSRWKKLCQHVI